MRQSYPAVLQAQSGNPINLRGVAVEPIGCPCHPGEQRDPRFAELDVLIASGWGSTPLYVIEIARRLNGGQLPSISGLRVGDDADAR